MNDAPNEPRSRSLGGRTVLVAGGTGNVGRVVVAALLREGARVVVPSRDAQKLAKLETSVRDAGPGRLHPVVGDVADARDAERVRDRVLSQAGGIDAVVATLGRFVPSGVKDATVDALSSVVRDYLVAHFVVARTYLPLLGEGGSYVFVNGPSAFQPFGGAALVSVATAAQAMLARAWMSELAGGPARVNELVLYTAFGWGAEAEAKNVITPGDVGRYVAWLASDRSRHVLGRTIHLQSPEQLRDLD